MHKNRLSIINFSNVLFTKIFVLDHFNSEHLIYNNIRYNVLLCKILSFLRIHDEHIYYSDYISFLQKKTNIETCLLPDLFIAIERKTNLAKIV